MGWGRTIVENMSEVGLAASAHHLHAVHAVRMIFGIDHAVGRNRLKEGRPSATAFKFTVAVEEGVTAGLAAVQTGFEMIPVRPREGPLGAFLARDAVYTRIEYLLPFGIRKLHLLRIGGREMRILVLFHSSRRLGRRTGIQQQEQEEERAGSQHIHKVKVERACAESVSEIVMKYAKV